METKVDIKKILINESIRGDCYRFLSACFYLPEKDILVSENLLKNLAEGLKLLSPPASVFSEEMMKGIYRYTDHDLQVEYAKLFVGPNELLAAPYGSVYLDEGRRIMGDSTKEVIKLYEEEGLGRDENFKELPDHVAVELEFMSFLIYKEIEALRKNDFKIALAYMEKQEGFLHGHLRQWIPLLCKKIKEGTDNLFYRALADCVSTFIRNSHLDSMQETIREKSLSI